MIAVIAIDNLICLAVFEVVRAVAKQQIAGTDFLATLLPGAVSFIIAIIIGALVGWVLSRYCIRIQKKNRKDHEHGHGQHALNSTLFAIMLTSIGTAHGLCTYMTKLLGSGDFPITPISTYGLYDSRLSSSQLRQSLKTTFSSNSTSWKKQFLLASSHSLVCTSMLLASTNHSLLLLAFIS